MAFKPAQVITPSTGVTTLLLGDAADGLAGIIAFQFDGTWATAGTVLCEGTIGGPYVSLAMRKQDAPDTALTSLASTATGIYYVDATCLKQVRLSLPLLTSGTLNVYASAAIG